MQAHEFLSPDRSWAARSLEFVRAVEKACTPKEVQELFSREIAQAGFNAHVMVIVDELDRSRRVIASGWHPEWARIYAKEDLKKVDPIHQHIFKSVEPFIWSDVRYDPQQNPGAKSVFQRARDFRMNEGFCVPMPFDGKIAAVSLAGENPDLSPVVRSALHAMSLFAHGRVRALGKSVPPPARGLLSSREREVLQWVSVGKSDWDIGAILHIAERTARGHVNSAARKLKAGNRAAAVVAALLAREISLG